MRKLYPFQESALSHCAGEPNPALFLEMRLGKTIVTIRACKQWKSERILVVAPLSVLAAWEEELARERESQVYRVAESGMLHSNGWHLVGYERLLSMFKRDPLDQFAPWSSRFDTVILDESTRIRNPQALTTKLCLVAFRNAAHRVILSGFPAPEGPLDYACQFIFLDGHFMGCRDYWQFRFRNFRQFLYDWEPKPGTRETIKKEVNDRAFVLSRKQAGIGERKIYETRIVEPTREQLALQRKVKKDFELGGDQTKWALVVQSWLHRIAGGHGENWEVISDAKALEVANLMQGELRNDKAVVLFRHNAELRLVWQKLKEAGIKAVWIDGSVDVEERKRRRLKFQSDNRTRAALLQIQTCKMGLDFSAASTAIYYSNSLAMEDRAQSEDRIVKVGKEEPLLYLDLVTRGTVDQVILDTLKDKNVEARFFMSRLLQRAREVI